MSRLPYSIVAALSIGLLGCPGTNPVECRDQTSCDLGPGGVCTVAPSGNQWCAYPDTACPSGIRYSDQYIGDGLAGTCVSDDLDASGADAREPVDGPPTPAFDVAYPSEWRFSVAGPTDGFMLIVNTGPAPLSLATFQVTSISDDHPTAVVRVTTPGSFGEALQPGTAGGRLGGLAEQLLVGSGLVTEARADTASSYLSLELINAPAGTYDIAASLTVALDGRDVAMPMTIHVVPGPTIYLDPLVARRVVISR